MKSGGKFRTMRFFAEHNEIDDLHIIFNTNSRRSKVAVNYLTNNNAAIDAIAPITASGTNGTGDIGESIAPIGTARET